MKIQNSRRVTKLPTVCLGLDINAKTTPESPQNQEYEKHLESNVSIFKNVATCEKAINASVKANI